MPSLCYLTPISADITAITSLIGLEVYKQKVL